jgi:hypothetical protein
MILSRAMAWACLTFLQWALVLVGALLLVLTVVQQWRSDAVAQPTANLLASGVALLLAWACRALAKRFA